MISSTTAWYIVGFSGTFLFGLRWFIQLWASKKARKSTFPLLFWYTSIAGSALLILYFTFGIQDPVGSISNLFPMAIAIYNIVLVVKEKSTQDLPNPTDSA